MRATRYVNERETERERERDKIGGERGEGRLVGRQTDEHI